MQFEWDDEKNEKLKSERGLSFEQAVQVWDDPNRAEMPARTHEGEQRLVMIGMINGKVHSVFFTMRGSTIRLITIRRAHPAEERVYEGA